MPQCVNFVAMRHLQYVWRSKVEDLGRRTGRRLLTGLWLAVMFSTGAPGQVIPSVGGDATLDVATWNVFWFGHPSNGPADDEKQFVHVRETIRQAGIDLWALQEVSNADSFERLLAELGSEYAGALATSGDQQRLAFVYRSDVVLPRGLPAVRHILTNQSDVFAGRPPLRLDAAIALADTTIDVIFITVHMKAFSDVASYERRLSASTALKNYLDFLHPRDAVFVLGDFNDRLTGSTTPGKSSPYLNFTSDLSKYRFVSAPLDERSTPTWCANLVCSAGTPLDHILITDELFPLYANDSTDRLDDLLQALPGFVSNTSDHLPVMAQFDPGNVSTTTERQPDLAEDAFSVFPSPFTHELNVVHDAAPLEVTIFDALGRRLFQVNPARDRLRVDTSSWGSGLYLVAVRYADSHRVIPVVRLK